MTSQRPFLLLRISFPGRPIFIQLVPDVVLELLDERVVRLPRPRSLTLSLRLLLVPLCQLPAEGLPALPLPEAVAPEPARLDDQPLRLQIGII